MKNERYQQIKAESDKLFAADQSAKTFAQLFEGYFDCPTQEAYLANLTADERAEYLAIRIKVER